METIDRQTILQNMDRLKDATEYDLLVEKCQNAKLISGVMVRNIEKDAGDNEDKKHELLLQKITERGPTAFTVFKAICEMDFKEAAEILKCRPLNGNDSKFLSISEGKRETERQLREMYEGKVQSSIKPRKNGATTSKNGSVTDGNKNKDEFIKLQPYDGQILNKLNVKKATKFHYSTREGIETYQMCGKHRGVLFLVNIIEFEQADKRRNGAEVDKFRLLDLFNQMGFELFYYENLTCGQFSKLIDQLLSSNYLRTTDCLVFGLLTHGNLMQQTTYVEFSDGLYYPTEQIVNRFSNTNCKYLQGKPKIFLFPFCRGDKSDKAMTIFSKASAQLEHDGAESIHVPERLPSFSDIAICYATVPGFVTHRDIEEGSWYIQGLASVFEEHAHNAPFEDLMRLIDNKVRKMSPETGKIQTSSVECRGFNKILYFNPGYYGTDTNGN